MFLRKFVNLLVLSGMLAAGSAHAVRRSDDGTGQVLIYPYFNTRDGNVTLVTLTNNESTAKVVSLRLLEGGIGRTMNFFTLYLGARDSWTGTLSWSEELGIGVVSTTDASCSWHGFEAGGVFPNTPGTRYAFMNVAQSGDEQRLREGWLEAIEVADVRYASTISNVLNAPMPAGATSRDCALVDGGFGAPGGYWDGDPNRDLLNPSGGLSGSVAIVNVGSGAYFSTPAVALQEFRVDPADTTNARGSRLVAHLAAVTGGLSLKDAITDPATGSARAEIVVDGRLTTLTYPRERAVDAVSAVLASSVLSAEFDATPAAGANTSFALLFPTRRYYADPELIGNAASATAPFHIPFRGFDAMERRTSFFNDREGAEIATLFDPNGCAAEVSYPATALALLAVGDNTDDPILQTGFHGFAGCLSRPLHTAGVADISFADVYYSGPQFPPHLRPSLEGHTVVGLPVIGTVLSNYIAAGAGVSAPNSYSAATPMRFKRSCTRADSRPCTP
jgi:hypothetical protein